MSETETVVEKEEEIKDVESESSADFDASTQKSEAVTETVEEVKTEVKRKPKKNGELHTFTAVIITRLFILLILLVVKQRR